MNKLNIRTEIMNGLSALKNVQESVSSKVPGCILGEDERPSPDQIRSYFLALIIETAELVQQLNWKPWKGKQPILVDRVIDEFADILAFLGIIIHYLDHMGISPEDLADGYAQKTLINISRFSGEVSAYKLDEPDDHGNVCRTNT